MQEGDLTNNPDRPLVNRAELESLAYTGLFLLALVVVGVGAVGLFLRGRDE